MLCFCLGAFLGFWTRVDSQVNGRIPTAANDRRLAPALPSLFRFAAARMFFTLVASSTNRRFEIFVAANAGAATAGAATAVAATAVAATAVAAAKSFMLPAASRFVAAPTLRDVSTLTLRIALMLFVAVQTAVVIRTA